jgi:hypothetical protein
MHREAVGLLPANHPNRLGPLNTLADALLLKFDQNRELGVLDEAISLRRELLSITSSPGNIYRPGVAKRLLYLLEKRREVTGDDRDYGEIEDLEAELAAFGV